MEISEVIRRWRAGDSQRRIASGTGLSRDTVARYITAAEALGVSCEGTELSEEQLSRLAAIGQPGPRQVETPSEELLAPWADQINRWLTGDRLQLMRIQELLAQRGLLDILIGAVPMAKLAQLAGPPDRHSAVGPHPEPGSRPQVGIVSPAGGADLLQHSFLWLTHSQSWRRRSLAWRQPGRSSAASPNAW